MDATQMHDVCERLIQYLETGTAPADLFTDDVFCDFTPPHWRIQAQGREGVMAIRQHIRPPAACHAGAPSRRRTVS